MIKKMESLNLETGVKDDDFDNLVDYVIEINDHIQNIIWEWGTVEKY